MVLSLPMQSHLTWNAAPCYNNYVPFGNYPLLPSLPEEGHMDFTGENSISNNYMNTISNNGINEGSSARRFRKNSIQKQRRRRSKNNPKQTFSKRTSSFRGVSRYTGGRYETFLWDNTEPEQKGKTVYIGAFEKEVEAARAYDLAALKLWGDSAELNFPLNEYQKDLEEMEGMSKNDYLLHIKRSARFAKGLCPYRGVSKNTYKKKWQARIGKGGGFKGVYLGTFETQEAAAQAYDVAAIRMKGVEAVTNFDLRQYDVDNIYGSTRFPIGRGASKMLRWSSVDHVLKNRRNTDHITTPLLQLHGPQSFDPTIHLQNLSYPNNPNPNQHVDPFSRYFNANPSSQVHVVPAFQNPNFQTNPNLNNWVGSYGGGSQIYGSWEENPTMMRQFLDGNSVYNEPLNQFGPILPLESHDQFVQNPSDIPYGLHLNQNPSSSSCLVQQGQVPMDPQTISPMTNLDPGPIYIGESSHGTKYTGESSSGCPVPEVSLDAMLSESFDDGIINQVLPDDVLPGNVGNAINGNVVEDFRVDKSTDLETGFPCSWLDMLLMSFSGSDCVV